jgi:hypothetical protein
MKSFNSLKEDYEKLKKVVNHNKTVINNTIKENEKIIEHYERAINKIQKRNIILNMEHAKIEQVLSTLHKKKRTRKIRITPKNKTSRKDSTKPKSFTLGRFTVQDYESDDSDESKGSMNRDKRRTAVQLGRFKVEDATPSSIEDDVVNILSKESDIGSLDEPKY